MSFGATLVADALRIITRLGQPATVQGAPVVDAGLGISNRPAAESTTATPPTVSSAFAGPDGGIVYGTTVSYCLPNVTPEAGGLLTIGDDTWRITRVRALKPGASVACYRMEVTS